MDKKKDVSIIIPAYNVEKYIAECLESLVKQTHDNIQIICVDDGSTDRTVDIIRKYAQKDKRIEIVQQKNLYAGVARNNGMERAKGKYIIFLDADDYFYPDMIEHSYCKIEETAADICIFDADIYREDIKKVEEVSWILHKEYLNGKDVFSPSEVSDYIFEIMTPAPWNKMLRREYIEKTGIKFQGLRRTNDLYFILSAVARASKICVLDEKLLCYRVGVSHNLQAENYKDPLAFYEALSGLKKELQKNRLYDAYKKSFVNVALNNIIYNINSINIPKIKTELIEYANSKMYSEFEINDKEREYFHASHNYNDYVRYKEKKYDDLVTIIVPAYNVEDKIERNVHSILNQTYYNFELLIIEDGSNDGTGCICDRLSCIDHRIRVIHTENRGVSSARNRGIRESQGKYIFFFDSDDFVNSNMVEFLIEFQKKWNADLVVCSFERFQNESQINANYVNKNITFAYSKEEFMSNLADIMLNMDKLSVFCPWNKLYLADIIKENELFFNENMSMGEDFLFNLSYFRSCRRIIMNDRKLYYYSKENANSLEQMYRKDLFNIQKKLVQSTQSLLEKEKCFHEENRLNLSKYFINRISYCLDKIVNNRELEKEEINQNIKVIIEDGYVMNCVEIAQGVLTGTNLTLAKGILNRDTGQIFDLFVKYKPKERLMYAIPENIEPSKYRLIKIYRKIRFSIRRYGILITVKRVLRKIYV